MKISTLLAQHKRRRNLILALTILGIIIWSFQGALLWLLLSLCLINVYGLLLMGTDKRSAIKGERFRIPERSFYLIAIVFGSLGIILAMTFFRHKTEHLSFKLLPLLIPLQLVLLYWLSQM